MRRCDASRIRGDPKSEERTTDEGKIGISLPDLQKGRGGIGDALGARER